MNQDVHPGSMGQKGTGSRIRIRNTAETFENEIVFFSLSFLWAKKLCQKSKILLIFSSNAFFN